MTTNDVLTRLSAPGPTSARRELAELIVEALYTTPLEPSFLEEAGPRIGKELLAAWLATPAAMAAVQEVVEGAVAALRQAPRAGVQVVPPEVRAVARAILERPFTPDRRLVLTIIDRPPLRAVVREILTDVVLEFGRRASAPVAGAARGLGALARRAQDTVKSRTGVLGELVGAVGTEVERQLERRAAEFVDQALAGVFAQLADVVADPSRAGQAAELRLAVLDGVLELTGPQLARELINADVPGAMTLVRTGLDRWMATPAADEVFVRTARELARGLGGRTLAAVLDRGGLAAPLRPVAVDAVEQLVAALVARPAFSGWVDRLLGP